MIKIQTRQNKLGDWWCNATLQCYDYSFEGKTIDEARTKMKELLERKSILESEVKWEEIELYPKKDKAIKSPIGYRSFRIDKGMV